MTARELIIALQARGFTLQIGGYLKDKHDRAVQIDEAHERADVRWYPFGDTMTKARIAGIVFEDVLGVLDLPSARRDEGSAA